MSEPAVGRRGRHRRRRPQAQEKRDPAPVQAEGQGHHGRDGCRGGREARRGREAAAPQRGAACAGARARARPAGRQPADVGAHGATAARRGRQRRQRRRRQQQRGRRRNHRRAGCNRQRRTQRRSRIATGLAAGRRRRLRRTRRRLPLPVAGPAGQPLPHTPVAAGGGVARRPRTAGGQRHATRPRARRQGAVVPRAEVPEDLLRSIAGRFHEFVVAHRVSLPTARRRRCGVGLKREAQLSSCLVSFLHTSIFFVNAGSRELFHIVCIVGALVSSQRVLCCEGHPLLLRLCYCALGLPIAKSVPSRPLRGCERWLNLLVLCHLFSFGAAPTTLGVPSQAALCLLAPNCSTLLFRCYGKGKRQDARLPLGRNRCAPKPQASTVPATHCR
ncbi:MAG: hypothetical protein J3K34DRAFT_67772 [Monoraphidium minutum]|nr:MAG: hypothetical protein J3K34DRAFT_67772 [Monoraphidium minutum]